MYFTSIRIALSAAAMGIASAPYTTFYQVTYDIGRLRRQDAPRRTWLRKTEHISKSGAAARQVSNLASSDRGAGGAALQVHNGGVPSHLGRLNSFFMRPLWRN